MGIGRPSTYASIIDTIQARDYVFKKGNALVPTWVAFSVAQLLTEHLPNLVDYKFTAQMEDDLDAISRGESGHVDYLRGFYFGNGKPGLKQQLANKVEEIDARDISRILIGTARRRRADLRARRPLWTVHRTRRAPREPARRDAARRSDASSWRWSCSTRPQQGEEPLGIAPRRTSRSI